MAEEKTFSLRFLFCITGMLRALITAKNMNWRWWPFVQNPNATSPWPCQASYCMHTPLCLSPLLSHFHSISLHRTWQNNYTYKATTTHNHKYRGKDPRERSGVGSSKLIIDWHAMQKKSKRISLFSRHTKCPFLSWRPLQASSSPSLLHSTSATHLHCSQGPHILWIPFCCSALLSSHPFTFLRPLWFVKSWEQKLSVSTWKVPEISRVQL